MFSVFLSSYRNTRESLGELKKAVETLACGSCSHNISHSPKLSLVFLKYEEINHFLGFASKSRLANTESSPDSPRVQSSNFHMVDCRD